jgi:hypothetical protein
VMRALGRSFPMTGQHPPDLAQAPEVLPSMGNKKEQQSLVMELRQLVPTSYTIETIPRTLPNMLGHQGDDVSG